MAATPSNRVDPARANHRRASGFTYVEMLVAAAIAAATITVAVIAFQAIARSGMGQRADVDVQLPGGTLYNFYGLNGTTILTTTAPNFGATATMAEGLRRKFYDDISSAEAVFCLGRNGPSTIRPTSIPIGTDTDARSLNSPETFRAFLAAADTTSATVFTPYRGASAATNASVFVLAPSASTTNLAVRAVYEVDLVRCTSPVGTYASVRRYEGTNLTEYYHVFYDGATNTFGPLTAYFERDALALEGDNTVDRYKKAANRPFAFLWWPDPAIPHLSGPPVTESISATEPRSGYIDMADRTSFFFVVPAFPAL